MISNVNSLAIVTSSICEPRTIVTSHWSIVLTLYLWTLSSSQWHCQPGRFSMAAHRHDRRGIYRCVLLPFRGRIEIDHSYGLRWSGLCCHSRHSTHGAARRGRATAGPTSAVPGVAAQASPVQTVSWSIPITHQHDQVTPWAIIRSWSMFSLLMAWCYSTRPSASIILTHKPFCWNHVMKYGHFYHEHIQNISFILKKKWTVYLGIQIKMSSKENSLIIYTTIIPIQSPHHCYPDYHVDYPPPLILR